MLPTVHHAKLRATTATSACNTKSPTKLKTTGRPKQEITHHQTHRVGRTSSSGASPTAEPPKESAIREAPHNASDADELIQGWSTTKFRAKTADLSTVERTKFVLETTPRVDMAVDVPSSEETVARKRASDDIGSTEDEPAATYTRAHDFVEKAPMDELAGSWLRGEHGDDDEVDGCRRLERGLPCSKRCIGRACRGWDGRECSGQHALDGVVGEMK